MKAAADWSLFYILVLAIIAAVLMFGVIKPSMGGG